MDLVIKKEEGKFTTQTFFKSVDRNSYLPLDSCHYTPWLDNIPKGQFSRLRRNCTIKEMFMKQVKLVGERFVQKGYRPEVIDERIRCGGRREVNTRHN